MSEASNARSARARTDNKNRGLIARIKLFFKQVAGELKKVVRPTRKELGQLFLTVIVFVAVVMAFVGIIDLAFGELVFKVFG
ncbi:MAG: preprotein translocase subunit SecE [Flaviflexus sp.]|nr:preprotein translocase subunit SecE [Flaviflexus sp.]